jgi:hypothetical protein
MTRWRTIAMLGCLLVAGCTMGRRGGDATTGAIAGRVEDANHEGVGGVTVTVLEPGPVAQVLGSSTSDRSGAFVVDHVPPGSNLVVRAVKTGSRVGISGKRQGVTVHVGRMTDVGAIQLRAGAD